MNAPVADAVLQPPQGQAAEVPADARRPRFTDLLAAERIKLASTRSAWWCAGITVALVVGPSALFMSLYQPEFGPVWKLLGTFASLPLAVIVVLSALAVTTEYRFGTMRTTFQAAPKRARALVAKTVVVVVVAATTGLVAGFGCWGVARLVAPTADLALVTEGHWRAVAGVAVVYAVTAVFAVGVGILLRHTAGAISAVLVWMFVVEGVLSVVPRVGPYIEAWLPFADLSRFLTAGVAEPDPGRSFFGERMLLGPWWGLAYTAGLAVVVLVLAIVVGERRDA